jgi:hypothetical protein
LFTRILPAASRLITIELFALSPFTDSTPALKLAVVAALAGAAEPAITPAAITVAASRTRAERRRSLSDRGSIVLLCGSWPLWDISMT